MKLVACIALVAICLFAQQAQGPLTDQRIAELVAAGVSTPEVIRIITSAPEIDFDLRPEATAGLMKAGASVEIIKAMAARENGGPAIPTPSRVADTRIPTHDSSATIQSGNSAGSITEVGVYRRENGQWIEMMPEMVNWKTGGVLKSLGTAGIVKGDVNGRLRGGQSKTRITRPISLLVYCQEGTQVTEYQLIHLRTHSNAREFRTVTGGVFHVSGNSDRDDLPFDSQHVAPRTWTILLEGLKAGEYGLLPPGAIVARSASAQLGKMYTFTVVE